jgi:hypothetical protein
LQSKSPSEGKQAARAEGGFLFLNHLSASQQKQNKKQKKKLKQMQN